MTPNLTHLPRYTDFNPLVPVYCATPNDGRLIHRFFDSSPLSPSGRYLALTRFPFEDRSPKPGDTAEVVLVNLESVHFTTIATTEAWGSQLGAQVQWGSSDNDLYFNQMASATLQPHGIRYNVSTGESYPLCGTIYHISPDGSHSASPCLLRTSRTQLGYGVLVPDKLIPENHGAPTDDGVYVTDTNTGDSRLLTSIHSIVSSVPYLSSANYADGDFYVFHTKWSPDGERIMVILRWTPRQPKRRFWQKAKPASKKTMRKFVLTIAADGTDPRIAITDELWARGGHHPNWCPDSRHVMMNLDLNGDGLRFVQADLDGKTINLMHPTAGGSGHPSLHPNGRFLLTDAYPGEPASYGDGTVPIRFIDLQTGEEKVIARINSRPAYVGDRKEMRLDAHPAWDRSGNYIIFNGCPTGTRQVFIADVTSLVS